MKHAIGFSAAIAAIVLAGSVMAQNATPGIRRIGGESSKNFRPGIVRKGPNRSWNKDDPRWQAIREALDAMDAEREAKENVIVVRQGGMLETEKTWNRRGGKGLVVIALEPPVYGPGLETKYDSEGRIESYGPYTNHLGVFKTVIEDFRKADEAAAATNAPAVLPSVKTNDVSTVTNAPTSEKSRPGIRRLRGRMPDEQPKPLPEGFAATSANTPFKAWGLTLGDHLTEGTMKDGTTWRLPGEPDYANHTKGEPDQLEPSTPYPRSLFRFFGHGYNFHGMKSAFDMDWQVYVYASVDNQIVGLSSHGSQHNFTGDKEEFNKSPIKARADEVLKLMKEQYGDEPEVIHNSWGVHYIWHKKPVVICLTMNEVRDYGNNTVSFNGSMSIKYIDTYLLSKAREAYKNIPPKTFGEEDKAKAKNLF